MFGSTSLGGQLGDRRKTSVKVNLNEDMGSKQGHPVAHVSCLVEISHGETNNHGETNRHGEHL